MTITPYVSMTIDALLGVLLFIAIIYFWRLDGKLKKLRAGNDRILEASAELQACLQQAERAVVGLRQASEDAGKDLQSKIDEARALVVAVKSPQGASDTSLRRRTSI
jgi:hypothetical protein